MKRSRWPREIRRARNLCETMSNKTGDDNGIRTARYRMNERCTLHRELQRQIVDKHEIIVELQTVLEAKVNVIIEVSK